MIVFDLLGVQNRDHGERGIARYILGLAIALEAADPSFVDSYLVHSHLPIPGVLDPLVMTGKLVAADEFARSAPIEGGTFIAGSLFELDESDETVIPLWARGNEWDIAAILYDLIPIRFPDDYLSNPAERYSLTARYSLFGMCDRVLAISEATAADGVQLLGLDPDRIRVVGAGADASFAAPDSPDEAASLIRSELGLDPGFVLVPTGIDPRKNNRIVFGAYSRLDPSVRRDHPLVLATRLSPPDRVSLEHLASSLSIVDNLVLPGFVADETLVALYQTAGLVVFASLYEGFGLPVLEAKRCGAPVICSDTSSLIEVLPDATARFDPHSTSKLTAMMDAALTSPGEAERLRQIGTGAFSWANSASATMSALAGSRQPVARRLALIAADPAGGEVARLKSMIPEGSFLAVYSPQGIGDSAPLSEFGFSERLHGAYHRVVYILDDDDATSSVIEALRIRPGLVDLTTTNLTGTNNSLPGSTGEALKSWYPCRYRPSVVAEDRVDAETADRFGIRILREIADLAHEVWVHSEDDATRYRLDTGSEAKLVADVVL